MLQDIVVLGANSALPLIDRFSSSFVLRTDKNFFLIDAGEGCQMKMGQFKVKRNRISHVFISHLHGDHVFGLPGLITSYNLNGRKDILTIYGPIGIKKYIDIILEVSQSKLGFELIINEIVEQSFQKLVSVGNITIHAFPLKHRIPTYGYLFKEENEVLNIQSDKIDEYKLTVEEIKSAKKGNNLERKNGMIHNDAITYVKEKPKSFAYCSDTRYDPSIVDFIEGVNLLYHEATYLDELREQAHIRFHSTASQAAEIALSATVKKLVIGHYSSRYKDIEALRIEALKTFSNVVLAEEGKIISIL
ncbi:MAG: ribonuclease Z [Saprospiraceae bacterium]